MRRPLTLLTTLTAPLALATTYPMTLHKVMDEQGTHGVAYQYLAPKGWAVKTQLVWSDRILQPTVFEAQADSPDGRFGYSMLGGMDFPFGGITGSHQFFGYQPGSKTGVEPPEKLTDFMLRAAQADKTISDIKVTRRVDRPLPVDQLPWQGRRYGMASELDFTFTKNGKTLSGVAVARMDVGFAGDPRQEMQAYNGDWEITNAFSVYSPPGEEKKALRFFSLGVPTYTPTKAFLLARGAYILALNHQIQEQIQQIGEISRLRAKLNRQQEDAIMGRYHADQSRKDKFQQDFCDYIGDVRRSRNTDGTELQTNSNDGQPWSDGRGNYAFGDNPGPGWTALKKWGE